MQYIYPSFPEGKRHFTFIFFLCFTGIFAGVFFGTIMASGDSSSIFSVIRQFITTDKQVFWPSLLSNLGMLLLIYLTRKKFWGRIISSILLFLESFSFGFCCNIIFSFSTDAGLNFYPIVFVISHVIPLATFTIAIIQALQQTPSKTRNRSPQRQPMQTYWILFISIIIACIIEAFYINSL